MLVFIDESGDTGLDIARGATRYFSMVLVAFEDREEAQLCDERIALLRHELGKPPGFEFHFHENSDRIREAFFKAVLPYGFFYYGIVINKGKLFGEGFHNKESFYKYACGLLFENAKDKLENATVIIDESGRQLFKYQLANYLKRRMNAESVTTRIKKVRMQDSHRNNLVQLADMVAGAVTRSLNEGKKDKTDYRKIVQSREVYVQIWPK
ncbi:MAG: DUF3800 domain-containing protein [Candidatus Moraniibacteriota bacterium]|nr:MAG: DUF3800 domain-containing protein [Candidatus Moranbacteria bacterium]